METQETTSEQSVREQIIAALAHPEAEEGLYLRNLVFLHEEDERPAVEANENQIKAALEDLVRAGDVRIVGQGENAIYYLCN